MDQKQFIFKVVSHVCHYVDIHDTSKHKHCDFYLTDEAIAFFKPFLDAKVAIDSKDEAALEPHKKFLNELWFDLRTWIGLSSKSNFDAVTDDQIMDYFFFIVPENGLRRNEPDFPSENVVKVEVPVKHETPAELLEADAEHQARLKAWCDEQCRLIDYVNELKKKRHALNLILLTLEKGSASYNDILNQIIDISKEIRNMTVKGDSYDA